MSVNREELKHWNVSCYFEKSKKNAQIVTLNLYEISCSLWWRYIWTFWHSLIHSLSESHITEGSATYIGDVSVILFEMMIIVQCQSYVNDYDEDVSILLRASSSVKSRNCHESSETVIRLHMFMCRDWNLSWFSAVLFWIKAYKAFFTLLQIDVQQLTTTSHSYFN